MLAQILNRQFVLEQTQDLLEELRADPGDDADVLNHLVESEQRELKESSGQPGFEPAFAERRGEEWVSLDDSSFFSRDPIISIVQSVLDEHFETNEPDQIEEQEPADDGRRGPDDDEVAVTNRTIRDYEPFRDQPGRRIFNKFSITDVGWVRSKVAEGIRLLRRKHPFNAKPAAPVECDDHVRLVLVGDWATGLPRARKVAEEIRAVLDDGKAKSLEQHVIHLGDTYYSGWDHEYRKRFLPFWPVTQDESDTIGSWSINGNHDMYSGGHAYYDVLLDDPRFYKQQKSSFFSLYNKHWRILGLDTAWQDGTLENPQADWVGEQLGGDNQTGLLLSHHQPFSAYEKSKPTIRRLLKPVLDSEKIRAWFWGHEHRCMLFKPHANVHFGRCVGHGGVPVYMTHRSDDPYPEPGEYEYREYIKKGFERWALFGFAVLEFDGPSIGVRYIDEDGEVHKAEELTT